MNPQHDHAAPHDHPHAHGEEVHDHPHDKHEHDHVVHGHAHGDDAHSMCMPMQWVSKTVTTTRARVSGLVHSRWSATG